MFKQSFLFCRKWIILAVFSMNFWKRMAWATGGCLFILALLGMERNIAGLPSFQIDVRHFSIKNRPDWISDVMEKEIVETVRHQGSWSMFDRDLVSNLTVVFENSVWVRKVKRIEKRFPDKILLSIDLARPVAKVNHNNRVLLVGDDTTILPWKYFNEAYLKQLPEIVKFQSRPPSIGKVWNNEEILGAISLVKRLEEEKLLEKLYISRLDVSNFDQRRSRRSSEINLMTYYNSEIYWGNPPNRNKFGRLSTDEKLSNLKRFVQNHTESLKGGYHYLDIRYRNDVVWKPRRS